jgi:hypothetical protein
LIATPRAIATRIIATPAHWFTSHNQANSKATFSNALNASQATAFLYSFIFILFVYTSVLIRSRSCISILHPSALRTT